MTKRHKLTTEQLDRQFKNMKKTKAPTKGWLRALREGLGLSHAQLGKLVGMTAQGIAKAEKNEAAGTITLNTLKKISAAVDCDLTYAVLPRTSLQEILEERAEKVATRIFKRTELHMSLEDQKNKDKFIKRRIKELAEELLRNSDRRLWDKL